MAGCTKPAPTWLFPSNLKTDLHRKEERKTPLKIRTTSRYTGSQAAGLLPVRFRSAKLEESVVYDADGREVAEYVAIRYKAEIAQGVPKTEEAMLDVIIRKDGVFEFVVWHPMQVGVKPPFSTCTFQFDPKSVTVEKIKQT